MNMNLDEAIKILTGEYPTHQKEEAIKVIYKLVEESAYYRDLVKLERKEKEHLKKSLKGQIAVKDTEINKLNNVIDRIRNKLEEHIKHCEQEAKGSLNNDICHISLKFDKELLKIITEERRGEYE